MVNPNKMEEMRYSELLGRLEAEPEAHVSAHDRESRRSRLLRFLRANCHDVEKTLANLKGFTNFWKEFRMDSISHDDEYDEKGPVFVCGEDTDGCPVLVARPCVHRAATAQDSEEAVRRCIYTVQGAVERMGPGMERFSVLYDVSGLTTANIDRHFIREFAKCAGSNYPGRIKKVYVINMNTAARVLWAVVSTFLDPVLKARIVMCGDRFDESVTLKQGIPHEHPYLEYVRQMVCKASRGNRAQGCLPKPSPYVQGWKLTLSAVKDVDMQRGISPDVSTQAEISDTEPDSPNSAAAAGSDRHEEENTKVSL
mmetsp:Transcript_24665/g.56948  ORF Transcript_24665/g.56948 Transcript_24665/m.56948 type:complete len:311 (+) Transcript_24665:33-965(+)